MKVTDHNHNHRMMKSAANAALKSISAELVLEREEEIQSLVANYEAELRKKFALHMIGTAQEFYQVDINRNELRITVKHV